MLWSLFKQCSQGSAWHLSLKFCWTSRALLLRPEWHPLTNKCFTQSWFGMCTYGRQRRCQWITNRPWHQPRSLRHRLTASHLHWITLVTGFYFPPLTMETSTSPMSQKDVWTQISLRSFHGPNTHVHERQSPVLSTCRMQLLLQNTWSIALHPPPPPHEPLNLKQLNARFLSFHPKLISVHGSTRLQLMNRPQVK